MHLAVMWEDFLVDTNIAAVNSSPKSLTYLSLKTTVGQVVNLYILQVTGFGPDLCGWVEFKYSSTLSAKHISATSAFCIISQESILNVLKSRIVFLSFTSLFS